MKIKLYVALARKVGAYHRSLGAASKDWASKHLAAVEYFCKNHLPSGAGFDSGTTLIVAKSTADRLVLHTEYHHMNEAGYAGWTSHEVVVRPSLAYGIDLLVKGRDRNEIKEYIGDIFQEALTSLVEEYEYETRRR